MKFTLKIIILSVLALACKHEPVETDSKTSLFTNITAETGIDFINTISNSKDFNIFNYRNFYNGGGVAIGDINNDGWVDVFFTSNLGSNKLYLNKGDLSFEDISSSAQIEEDGKWSTGVVMVDINSDGLLDIYVCNAGYRKGVDQKNALFINNGDLSFTERAAEYGLDDNGYTTHAAFFDYDKDGDLDVYLLNNSFIPVNTLNYNNKRELRASEWDVKDFLKGGGDKFLKNDNGKFTDVSAELGIYGSLIGFGLGVTLGDVNNDGFIDIYVSNDFFERDYLYINNGGKSFTEELEKRLNHISHSSMGADMADINNDGKTEIFVTDMLPDDEYRLKTTSTFDNIDLRRLKVKQGFYNQFMHNTLQLNSGDGYFKEVAHYAGVAATDWSWGALMFDADNDGLSDLFVCNGIYNEVIDQDFIDFFANDILQRMALTGKKEEIDSIINHMPSIPIKNKAFRNMNGLNFNEVTDDWGFTEETFSNGAAYGDLDNDGDLDLVINNVNQTALIYKNNSVNDFIGFKLIGSGDNKLAIGARVELFSGDQQMSKELIPSRGFQSSVDYRITFGLSKELPVDSVCIRWPDGKYSKHVGLEKNLYHTISESELDKSDKPLVMLKKTLFVPMNINLDAHSEDDFIDFYYERNIPNQLSHEGPCSAVADINGDGYLDLFVGGSAGQSASLYVYQGGKFVKTQEEYFAKFKAMEDTASEFFDADGDGDMDLIVGSGGNNVTYDERAFIDRLYINNNGQFELKFNALPKKNNNTAVIKCYDYDLDGDLDLFIGTRSVPGQYGLSPGSHILNNNGSAIFMDVTEKLAPELKLAGMITDAVVSDILENKGEELVIVGEWMSPKILAFNGIHFDVVTSSLDSFSGWWQSISANDLDKDGKVDLVLGNIGENFYLKADKQHPIRMWINDFDSNGSLEKIITRTIDGRDVPVSMKRDMTDQLSSLKKQNLKHSEYATKSIHQLFPKEVLLRSSVRQINYMPSIVAMNRGDGIFEIEVMDPEVQLSCINEIVADDFNGDGNPDLFMAGNNHFFLPQFSMLDANDGLVLINDGEGKFNVLDGEQSGLKIKGVVRSAEYVKNNNESLLMTFRNNDTPMCYKLNK